MYLVGFFGASWLAGRNAERFGFTREQVSDMIFYGFLGVILGGRIGYVLFYNFDLFLADPTYLFKIWTGGMSFHGGLIGVITAMIWTPSPSAYRGSATVFVIACGSLVPMSTNG